MPCSLHLERISRSKLHCSRRIDSERAIGSNGVGINGQRSGRNSNATGSYRDAGVPARADSDGCFGAIGTSNVCYVDSPHGIAGIGVGICVGVYVEDGEGLIGGGYAKGWSKFKNNGGSGGALRSYIYIQSNSALEGGGGNNSSRVQSKSVREVGKVENIVGDITTSN